MPSVLSQAQESSRATEARGGTLMGRETELTLDEQIEELNFLEQWDEEAAALERAAEEGERYNPEFLAGGPGRYRTLYR